ncbi:hypothetical protein SAMN05421736_12233 [Evansella caseinilytica]|uniref:Uncharacterized protein n=1 Tax=Evansella caseinilytica TaxID=1503961 RepID=A0A1H3UJJ8_9BACI|nr:hypothetical protein [Evansella caseinilytica]SDZ62496.1 hypothetical protein SAMN05421736_12233 [Evansella caseinilytica]
MARRSRRGSREQRSVHYTYVSSGETTQRRDSQTMFPGLFEHPKKMVVQKGGHNIGKKIEARQSRAAERTLHVREQRRDNATKRFADNVFRTF